MNLQQPTTNDRQTTNVQRPMPFGLGVGGWKNFGRWLLVVVGSATGGLLAGCCSELRTGWDAHNEGVLLRATNPDQAARHFETARTNLTQALKSCDLSTAERQRVWLMLVRIELYRGDPNSAGVMLALSGFRSGKTPGSPWPDRTLASLTTAEIHLHQGMYNMTVLADFEPGALPDEPVLIGEALRHFDNAVLHLKTTASQNEDLPARDLAIHMTAHARFEKAKAMELHDEKTRKANLTAAGAELEALAKEMAERAPEHPGLLREYGELKTKIAEERERVNKALGR